MIIITLLALCAVAGWAIARHENHPVWGALMGAALGPIGLTLVAISGWRAHRQGRWQ